MSSISQRRTLIYNYIIHRAPSSPTCIQYVQLHADDGTRLDRKKRYPAASSRLSSSCSLAALPINTLGYFACISSHSIAVISSTQLQRARRHKNMASKRLLVLALLLAAVFLAVSGAANDDQAREHIYN